MLLQYNAGSDSLTYEELETGTGMSADTLKPLLALFTKQKILEHRDDSYDLNLGASLLDKK